MLQLFYNGCSFLVWLDIAIILNACLLNGIIVYSGDNTAKPIAEMLQRPTMTHIHDLPWPARQQSLLPISLGQLEAGSAMFSTDWLTQREQPFLKSLEQSFWTFIIACYVSSSTLKIESIWICLVCMRSQGQEDISWDWGGVTSPKAPAWQWLLTSAPGGSSFLVALGFPSKGHSKEQSQSPRRRQESWKTVCLHIAGELKTLMEWKSENW